MYIQEIFDDLAFGEFSDTRLLDEETNTLNEIHIPRVLSFLNLGLLDLYKRFILFRKKILLYEQSGVTQYYIRPDYIAASSNSLDDNNYLLETGHDLFEDDLIKIIEVFEEDDDDEDVLNNTPLNDPANRATGLFTKTFDTLELVNADTMRTFIVWYQAKYPQIVYDSDFDAESYPLYIPPFIKEALLYFLGARLFKAKVAKGSEGGKPAFNTYEYLYEQECIKIKREGFVEELQTNRDRFTAGKFV